MRKIKQMWVLMCTSLMVLLFAACTNNRDSEIKVQRMQEQESKDIETREEFVESDIDEETLNQLVEYETELENMADYYEAIEVSQLDYDSFESRMSDEEWEGFKLYFPILKENVSFQLADYRHFTELNKDGEAAKDGEKVVFYRYISEEVTDINSYAKGSASDGIEEMMIWEVRVFDLDGDGVQELILEWSPVGDFLILHRENEDFYGWNIVYRGFNKLQTNGTYISSSGASSNYYCCIRFDNGSWLEENLFEEDGDEYYMNGEPTDKDTFWQQVDAYMTGDVIGYKPKRRVDIKRGIRDNEGNDTVSVFSETESLVSVVPETTGCIMSEPEELLDAFLASEIEAFYDNRTDTILMSELLSYSLKVDGEDYFIYSVGERVDLDNDGENELIINGPYGGIYIDARDGKVYILAAGEGTTGLLSYTYYDNAVWIVHSDVLHAGRKMHWLTKYDGEGNIIDAFLLSAEYWDSPNDSYDENSIFTYRDEKISMTEYEELRKEIMGY